MKPLFLAWIGAGLVAYGALVTSCYHDPQYAGSHWLVKAALHALAMTVVPFWPIPACYAATVILRRRWDERGKMSGFNGKQDMACRDVLREVLEERRRQHERFGEQELPSGTGGQRAREIAGLVWSQRERAIRDGLLTWRHLLEEEVCEALAEHDPEKLRVELIQVAAVAVQWAEALSRRADRPC